MYSSVRVVQAVAEAIREAGEIPTRQLYELGATDLAGFHRIVGILVNAGVIGKRGDLLVWLAAT